MSTSEGVHPTANAQGRRPRCSVLVRGLGDVASATAHRLFRDGYAVAIHNGPDPPKTLFDAEAVLDGLTAGRCEDSRCLSEILEARAFLPVLLADLKVCGNIYAWDVVVDARMQKRIAPEDQRGMAALTIGLGPGQVAGRTADMAVETSWGDRLGAIIGEGSTLPLAGEPRAIEGVGRERNVYALVSGMLRSDYRIGDAVTARRGSRRNADQRPDLRNIARAEPPGRCDFTQRQDRRDRPAVAGARRI